MSKKWEELTDEFYGVSAEGQRFRMLEYTTMLDDTAMSKPNAPPVKGLKRICTSKGHHCNRIDADTFEIVELGLQVKRV